MKHHRILQSFNGSQTGLDIDFFEEGTVRELSDSLAEIALGQKWVAPHSPALRETKVIKPDETKPFDLSKLNRKQLAEFGKENFGLELDENGKRDDMLAAIAKAVDEAKSQD